MHVIIIPEQIVENPNFKPILVVKELIYSPVVQYLKHGTYPICSIHLFHKSINLTNYLCRPITFNNS